MKLSVTHETRYDYAYAVEQAHHIAHMRPLSSSTQQLLSHTLRVQPEPAALTHSIDSYGQQRVYFELAVPHAELVVTAESVVITHHRFEFRRACGNQRPLLQRQTLAHRERREAQ